MRRSKGGRAVIHLATALQLMTAMTIGLPAPGQIAMTTIDKDTKCQVIVDYLNNKDSPHAQQAYRVAKELMTDLDKAAAAKGKNSLIDPLTPEHAENVYILVVESCRDYPQQTLGQTAADTYAGLRDLRNRPATH
jgi:hypothetical protein